MGLVQQYRSTIVDLVETSIEQGAFEKDATFYSAAFSNLATPILDLLFSKNAGCACSRVMGGWEITLSSTREMLTPLNKWVLWG